jgi:putative phosphoribosyl transferase
MPHAPAEQEVRIESGGVSLPGTLSIPPGARGVVVFAHGSGSSRLSPRNIQVARSLNRAGCGTLLLDLLSPEEADRRASVFDIGLLGARVEGAVAWLRATHPDLRVGCFGASTGAAAALVAAADLGDAVAAVVSRGGRPDLAGDALARVTAPTLLIVGALDGAVLELNRKAQARLERCQSRLLVIEGAGHLFEEPGTLAVVAARAGEWFGAHFAG